MKSQFVIDAESHLRRLEIDFAGKKFSASDVMNVKMQEERCRRCGGTVEDVETFRCYGHQSVLLERGGRITTVSRKCERKSAIDRQISITNLIGEMPVELRYCSLQNFSLVGVSKSVVLAAERAAEAMQSETSLVLAGGAENGGVGVGKTHLAAAIIVDAFLKGKSGFFVSVPMLMNQLKSFGAEGKYEKILEEACSCDVIVLDDLGVENYTGWVAEQLYMIVNERYERRTKTMTIVTTNYATPSELTERMGDNGTRIVSRLYGMGAWVAISGEDYRIKKRLKRQTQPQRELTKTGTEG